MGGVSTGLLLTTVIPMAVTVFIFIAISGSSPWYGQLLSSVAASVNAFLLLPVAMSCFASRDVRRADPRSNSRYRSSHRSVKLRNTNEELTGV